MKKLGFCLMRLPLTDPDDYSSVDIEAVKLLVDEFMSKGFTYFDTAASYHAGNSEVAFREAVAKRYPRSAYTITDKLHLLMLNNPEDMQGTFSEQMERLGLDYVDYYWLHDLGEHSYHQAEAFHAFEFVQQLKAEGKVKHIGLSFYGKAELLDEILTKHPEMEYVQLQLNYLDWQDTTIQSRLCYEVATRHRKPVIVMESIKGDSLVNIPQEAQSLFKKSRPDLSVNSWAIRFAASLKNVMMVMSGINTPEQMADDTSYMQNFCPLNEEEQTVINTVATMIHDAIAISSTACS